MEHLEDQVSDLRSFLIQTQAPSPATPMARGPAANFPPTPRRHPSSTGLHHNVGSPLSATGDHHGIDSAHASPFAHDHRNHSAGAGGKRKSGDTGDTRDTGDTGEGSAKQSRSKRNRYISIACNECKRRKIKCNGETPCQRCGNLNLQCLYSPNCCTNNFKESDEFKQMSDNVSRLQEQVDNLYRNINVLRQETTLRLAPIQNDHDRVQSLLPSSAAVSPSTSLSSQQRQDHPHFRPPPAFRGPTSNAFTVDVAKNTLHNLGYSGAPEGTEDNGIVIEDTSTPLPLPQSYFQETPRPRDPLWDFTKDEMVRLCRVHEDEVGIMYPVVDINDVIKHARFLANFMEGAKKTGFATPGPGQDEGISDIKTLELKIIMCCALVVEEHGYSIKAIRLWDSIQPIVDRMLMSDPSDVSNMPFLALVGGYRFLTNNEILAWRVIGQVARLCLEMGLHRREGIERIPGEQDRKNAINTFWTAYVLDRRWSFGTGFPFVVHDDKIDPQLPYPEEYPYLTSMITFSKLGAKVWRLVDYFDSVLIRNLKRDDFEKLDREILEWYETVPEKVKTTRFNDHMPVPLTPTYDNERLQIWTRLRLNQMRIWLHTPALHSASSIAMHPALAQCAVDLAKETIRYLARLNNTTDLYRRLQVFYHHFLTSAIAVLFLASTHAPLHFSSQCRDEFHMSLELIKDMSAKSWVSQRLWRTVRSLKAYAPRLGLQVEDDPGQRENAILAMTGLAASGQDRSINHRQDSMSSRRFTHSPVNQFGHPPTGADTLAPRGLCPAQDGATSAESQSPDDRENGLRLQSEMSKMFEGFANGLAAGHDGRYRGHDGFMIRGEQSHDRQLDHAADGGVFLHMREMF